MTTTSVDSLLQHFSTYKVLVVGDVILDEYLEGEVVRISPEAPVPVVDISSKEVRLGGAANVALNLRQLGAEVLLCSTTGDDKAAEQLSLLSKEVGIDISALLSDPSRKTTRKTRVLAEGHHILRIDEEIQTSLSNLQSKRLQQAVCDRLPLCQLIIFQDYDKGVLSTELIAKILSTAQKYDIPVAVDPKRRQFFAYKGATLFKPNLKEFEESTHFSWKVGDISSLRKEVLSLRNRMKVDTLLVTLSEQGMYAQSKETEYYEVACRRKIVDVSGAGDAVISVAALCKAYGLSVKETLKLANLAGGLVCETPGVVPITAKQLSSAANNLSLPTAAN